MTVVRAAIIGCGKIADAHATALRRIPIATLAGVCDREPLMAGQLAERYGVGYSSGDVADMLQTARPDVVHITTPPQSHCALALQCLEAGSHVYVEKPFTLDTADAERLIRATAERNLKLTAGHNAQYLWENVEARKLVKAGYLGGPPVHIESYQTYALGDASYARALLGDANHWVRRLPGKLLHNIISHGIARIAELMDTDAPIVSAAGFTSPLLLGLGETDIVDELRVHISDGRNMTASFVFSTQVSPPVNGFRIYGPRNSLVVDNAHHTLTRIPRTGHKSYLNYFIPPLSAAREQARSARKNVGRFLRAEFHDDSGMKNLIEAFYGAILGRNALPVTPREILLTSRIMDGIFAQVGRNLPAEVSYTTCS
jgi:predicted dehydrogenase